ncbi:MAG: ABC transporter permease [Planctomycetes bacterium]|nr:ABC transporter permease [Planctomycetota bacterium]
MSAPGIDVRAQHTIPLAKATTLCLKGITHRLFRSLLTLMVIVLAVAFFMTLLCEAAFTRAIGRGVMSEAAEQRIPERRAKIWFSQPSQVLLATRLATATQADIDEFAAVSGVEHAHVQHLVVESDRQARLLAFFATMDAGSRAVLIGKVKGREVFTHLSDPAGWEAFTQGVRQVHAYSLPLPLPEIKTFIDGYPGYIRDLDAFASAWKAGVSRFTAELAPIAGTTEEAGWRAWLVSADAGQLATVQALLARHGFRDTLEIVARVRQGLADAQVRDQIAAALDSDKAVVAWKKTFLNDPSPDQKMGFIADKRVERVLEGRWSHERLTAVAAGIDHEHQVANLEKVVSQRIPDQRSDALINGRQAFLMAISFVVCMVGIANAMLMAITERFREIATMKCLGATDGFILQQFLMEAGIQGLAGGAVGMVIGAVLAVAKGSVVYGSYLYGYFPIVDVLIAAAICIATGVLLSTLASIYPSWTASRMAPMDAMRVE